MDVSCVIYPKCDAKSHSQILPNLPWIYCVRTSYQLAICNTAAPGIASFFSALNARFASLSGNT
jgi:hypothetical protein